MTYLVVKFTLKSFPRQQLREANLRSRPGETEADTGRGSGP